MKRVLLVLVLIIVSKGFGLPAFPGAEGFGSETVGGRGGEVYIVTNLNDVGLGSLRYGIENRTIKGTDTIPRVIVFNVCGNIQLAEPIDISLPYLTIAGQTAPNGGICIKNVPSNWGSCLRIYSHDIILRHLRIRPGVGSNGDQMDAIGISGDSKNIIVDHCSISWATDETFQVWTGSSDDCKNIILQWSIISESLDFNIHPKGAHGMGVLISEENTRNVSVHHNLLAHNSMRNPFIKTPDGVVEFVNNVIYNWGNGGLSGEIDNSEGDQKVNFVGNYYKEGSRTTSYSEALTLQDFNNQNSTNNDLKIYLDNNKYNDNNGNTSDVVPVIIGQGISATWPDIYQELTPHPVAMPVYTNRNVTTEMYNEVLDFSGAYLPLEDDVDNRIKDDVVNRTGSIINCVEALTKIMLHQGTINTINNSGNATFLINGNSTPNLTNPVNNFLGHLIEVNGEVKKIIAHNSTNNEITVNGVWTTLISSSDNYEIYCDHTKNAGGWPNLNDNDGNGIPDPIVINDADNDGMDDSWEAKYKVSSPNADNDNDGYTNIEEFLNKTIPNSVLVPGSGSIRPLLVSPTEITEAEYGDVMKRVPLCFNADEKPMTNVTYFDAILYCNARSKREKLDTVYAYTSKVIESDNCTDLIGLNTNNQKNGYRLPKREEWEYCYLGGKADDYNSGYYWPAGSDASDYAHYGISETQPVGTLLPNGYGLYDMAGNVSEWVTLENNPDQDYYKMNGDFSSSIDDLVYNVGNPNIPVSVSMSGFVYNYSKVGFRVVRKAPDITPAINLLLD